MPNKKIPQSNEETDFSGYFQKKETAAKKEQKFSAIQELPTVKATQRIKYLIIALIVLAIAQFILFYITNKQKSPGIPDGYQVINEPGSPPFVVPIK